MVEAHLPGTACRVMLPYPADPLARCSTTIFHVNKEYMPQIVAGEEIEHAFGVRFGFSTLAAAGLGNLISDVVGIGTAEPVQVRLH